MRVLTLYVAILVGFFLALAMVLAMVGCASAGFYQMSADWCSQHLEASSANRCPKE